MSLSDSATVSTPDESKGAAAPPGESDNATEVLQGSHVSVKHRYNQGRSQPHSLGWSRVPLSSFFPQISINFSYFPQTLLIFFLILAFQVGECPTREGPGHTTAVVSNVFKRIITGM